LPFRDRAGVIEEVKVLMALEAAVRSLNGQGKSSLTISRKLVGAMATSQQWIVQAERSGLLTPIAMENTVHCASR